MHLWGLKNQEAMEDMGKRFEPCRASASVGQVPISKCFDYYGNPLREPVDRGKASASPLWVTTSMLPVNAYEAFVPQKISHIPTTISPFLPAMSQSTNFLPNQHHYWLEQEIQRCSEHQSYLFTIWKGKKDMLSDRFDMCFQWERGLVEKEMQQLWEQIEVWHRYEDGLKEQLEVEKYQQQVVEAEILRSKNVEILSDMLVVIGNMQERWKRIEQQQVSNELKVDTLLQARFLAEQQVWAAQQSAIDMHIEEQLIKIEKQEELSNFTDARKVFNEMPKRNWLDQIEQRSIEEHISQRLTEIEKIEEASVGIVVKTAGDGTPETELSRQPGEFANRKWWDKIMEEWAGARILFEGRPDLNFKVSRSFLFGFCCQLSVAECFKILHWPTGIGTKSYDRECVIVMVTVPECVDIDEKSEIFVKQLQHRSLRTSFLKKGGGVSNGKRSRELEDVITNHLFVRSNYHFFSLVIHENMAEGHDYAFGDKKLNLVDWKGGVYYGYMDYDKAEKEFVMGALDVIEGLMKRQHVEFNWDGRGVRWKDLFWLFMISVGCYTRLVKSSRANENIMEHIEVLKEQVVRIKFVVLIVELLKEAIEAWEKDEMEASGYSWGRCVFWKNLFWLFSEDMTMSSSTIKLEDKLVLRGMVCHDLIMT